MPGSIIETDAKRHLTRIDYLSKLGFGHVGSSAFCMNLAHDFPAFGPDVWGITASDSAKGYLAWGGPPRDPDIDGTIVPSAAGGSLMFTPELATRALWTMPKYGAKILWQVWICGRVQSKDRLDRFGCYRDQCGIILLSAENMRSGDVWRWFMQNRELPLAMRRVGLVECKRSNSATDFPDTRGFEFRRWEKARFCRLFFDS